MVDSPKELAAKWIAMALDPEWRRVLGKAARARPGGFTWDNTAKAFEELALEAASKGSRCRG
jgi:glycosyltransferase involved in cell wall biosynthesis